MVWTLYKIEVYNEMILTMAPVIKVVYLQLDKKKTFSNLQR